MRRASAGRAIPRLPVSTAIGRSYARAGGPRQEFVQRPSVRSPAMLPHSILAMLALRAWDSPPPPPRPRRRHRRAPIAAAAAPVVAALAIVSAAGAHLPAAAPTAGVVPGELIVKFA